MGKQVGDRSALLGSGRNDSRAMGDRAEEVLEDDNNRRVDELASQIRTLKSLTIEIDQEVKDQNRYLDGMGDDFDGTQGLLGGSMARLQQLAKSGGGRTMWYMAGFCVLVFFIIYTLA